MFSLDILILVSPAVMAYTFEKDIVSKELCPMSITDLFFQIRYFVHIYIRDGSTLHTSDMVMFF